MDSLIERNGVLIINPCNWEMGEAGIGEWEKGTVDPH